VQFIFVSNCYIVTMWTCILLVLVAFLQHCFAQGQNHYLYGPMWGWRSSPGAKGYIINAETTLHPGKVPEKVAPRLAIWPGLDVPKGLVQPIIVSSSEPLYQGEYVLAF
jgi:hypothetical protein